MTKKDGVFATFDVCALLFIRSSRPNHRSRRPSPILGSRSHGGSRSYGNQSLYGSRSHGGSRQRLVLGMLLMGLTQTVLLLLIELRCSERHLFLSSLTYVMDNSIIRMMTNATCGTCTLVYIKADSSII